MITTAQKALHTIGFLLLTTGVYLLLLVGGMLANEHYLVAAASGVDDAPVDEPPALVLPTAQPQPSLPAANATTAVLAAATTTSTVVPTIIADGSGVMSSIVPTTTATAWVSTITRIAISKIKVDKKVVQVGWTTTQDANGQETATWNTDKYRVGHHQWSGNPGGGTNIVLSGHSGGIQFPFNDLFYLAPGDQVKLYSAGYIFSYVVTEHLLLDEVGQPPEKRLANVQYLAPTDQELVTLVACWPLKGPDKFKQRIVIRAKPTGAAPKPQKAAK